MSSAIGLIADRALGEPPGAIHPVSAFGRAMTALEQRLWRDSGPAGVRYTGAGIALGCAAGVGLDRAGRVIDRAGVALGCAGGLGPDRVRRVNDHAGVTLGCAGRKGAVGRQHRDDRSATSAASHARTFSAAWARATTRPTRGVGPDRCGLALDRTGLPIGEAGVVSARRVPRRRRGGSSLSGGAIATWLVVAGRALGDEARAIGQRLIDDDLDGARRRLPALVGRDPDSLDAKGVARAVVESVAENTVDAVVAPACWAALGGAAGAGFYRAVNTLDAMVGHRNERYGRFGWASARLDDIANWMPARLTALLVAAVRPAQARDVLDALLHPPAHPSPNAGVAEAAFAAALGLRLGGDTVYAGRVDPRPALGTGRSPEPADINAAIRLSRDVTLALAALLAAPAVAIAFTRRHPHPTPRRTNPR